VGVATPRHAHFDGGRAGIFHQGLPFPKNQGGEASQVDKDRKVFDHPDNARVGEEHKHAAMTAAHLRKLSTPPSVVSIEEALLQLVASQTVIQFHCCTPGNLEPIHGATGMYEGSHLLVSAALRKVYESLGGDHHHSQETKRLEEKKGESSGDDDETSSSSEEHSRSVSDHMTTTTTTTTTMVPTRRAGGNDRPLLPWSSVEAALKDAACPQVEPAAAAAAAAIPKTTVGENLSPPQSPSLPSPSTPSPSSPLPSPSPPSSVLEGLLSQPSIRGDSVLLVVGTLVHGTMRAREAMPGGLPRVIMNAKVKPTPTHFSCDSFYFDLCLFVPFASCLLSFACAFQ
jgi:hypothetical protein